MSKICSSCGSKAKTYGKKGWRVAGAVRIKKIQNLIDTYFQDERGFFINVTIPRDATHIWMSEYLTPDYKSPPDVLIAYTGQRGGKSLRNIIGVKDLDPGSVLRLRAPVSYRDTKQQVYPPHVHCRLRNGTYLTLPFLVPECGYHTVMEIAKHKKHWKLIYVLNNQSDYSSPLLPRTRVITEATNVPYSFDTPLLLYCAKKTCNASHKMAKRLYARGYTMVAVYVGGMEEVDQHFKPV